MPNLTPKEYDQKIDKLAFEVSQLVLTHLRETLGYESRDFNHCKALVESELKNPVLNALDHYLHNND